MDILFFVIGFILCFVLSLIFYKVKCAGYLRIDHLTSEETDYYLIDISKDLDTLKKKKSIVLKIDNSYKKPQ